LPKPHSQSFGPGGSYLLTTALQSFGGASGRQVSVALLIGTVPRNVVTVQTGSAQPDAPEAKAISETSQDGHRNRR
jgi:hypothetical protein